MTVEELEILADTTTDPDEAREALGEAWKGNQGDDDEQD